MIKFNHWTPEYIFNRIVVALYEKQHPEQPWLTSSAISILSTYLKKTDVGLEWGSGRSTAWFAKRLKHLVSIENNPDWYKKVNSILQAKNLNNVDYKLIDDENNYVEIADLFPMNSLNFALVDGLPSNLRSACALKAVEKIKIGGCIVIDNANWFLPCNSNSPNSRTYDMGPSSDEWQNFLDLVKNWRTIWTTNGVTDTAFFIRTSIN